MDDISIAVLGLGALLLLVSALPRLAGRLAIPVTALFAGLGAMIGALIGFAPDNWGLISDIAEGVRTIGFDASILLPIFLPILLFEAALHLDTRALLDDLGPILALAVVAVLVTTLFAGVAVWATSGIALSVCLLLASIIATTDPAAVISIFDDVGAPRRLRHLVESESLLNDAAAIALFSLFLGAVTAQAEPDPLTGSLRFLWMFAGGTALGLAAGQLATLALRRIAEGKAAQMTLIITVPYLVYVTGETYLGVSGVVAVIAAALVIGAHGRTRIVEADWAVILAIWGQLSFWASSLIFLLASMAVPEALQIAELSDLGLLAILVTAALAARAVVLWLFLPRLAEGTVGVEHRYRVVMLWGGIRGAVTVALALSIRDNPLVGTEATHAITVLAIGFVLFTLFIQATTLRPLIHGLGLDHLSPADRMLRNRALQVALTRIIDQLDTSAREMELDPAAARSIEDAYRKRQEDLCGTGQGEIARQTLFQVCLISLTRYELDLCRRLLREHMVSPTLAAALVRRAEALRDLVQTRGADGYLSATRRNLNFPWTFRLALWLHARLGIAGPLARQLAERFELLLVRLVILRELQHFTRHRLRDFHADAPVEAIAELLRQRRALIEGAFAALKHQYAAHGKILETRYLARMALQLEDASYHDLHEQALVSRDLHHDLLASLRRRRRQVEEVPPVDLDLDVVALVRGVPLFDSLSEDRLRAIAGLLRPRLAVPGEELVRRGSRGDRMFFIASGEVEVRLDRGPVHLGSGEIFGEIALLTRQPRTADVICLGYTRLLVLEGRDFRRFIRTDPTLRRSIDRIARERLRPAAAPVAASGD